MFKLKNEVDLKIKVKIVFYGTFSVTLYVWIYMYCVMMGNVFNWSAK